MCVPMCVCLPVGVWLMVYYGQSVGRLPFLSGEDRLTVMGVCACVVWMCVGIGLIA